MMIKKTHQLIGVSFLQIFHDPLDPVRHPAHGGSINLTRDRVLQLDRAGTGSLFLIIGREEKWLFFVTVYLSSVIILQTIVFPALRVYL